MINKYFLSVVIGSVCFLNTGCATDNSIKKTLALTQENNPKISEIQTERLNEVNVKEQLKSMYPSTEFNSVSKSLVDGLYEVRMGNNIAYTDKTGRFFIFGSVYDMETQIDLTAEKRNIIKGNNVETANTPIQRNEKVITAKYPAEYLDQAIKRVNGDGSNEIALFSDIDCGYCKKLEVDLENLDNTTIYTFLTPFLGDIKDSVSVWCSDDKATAMLDYMLEGKKPKVKDCENPMEDNLSLANDMGIRGTPYLIKSDGTFNYGYMNTDKLNEWVNK